MYFCVTDRNQVLPRELMTVYRRVIVFGRAHISEDDAARGSGPEKAGFHVRHLGGSHRRLAGV